MEYDKHVAAIQRGFNYFQTYHDDEAAVKTLISEITLCIDEIHKEACNIYEKRIGDHKVFLLLLTHCADMPCGYMSGMESVTKLFDPFPINLFLTLLEECKLSTCLCENLAFIDEHMVIALIEILLPLLMKNMFMNWSTFYNLSIGYFNHLEQSLTVNKSDIVKYIDEFTDVLVKPINKGSTEEGKLFLLEVHLLQKMISLHIRFSRDANEQLLIELRRSINSTLKHMKLELKNISMLTLMDWNECELKPDRTLNCEILEHLFPLKTKMQDLLNDPVVTEDNKSLLHEVMKLIDSIFELPSNADVNKKYDIQKYISSNAMNPQSVKNLYFKLHELQFHDCSELLKWVAVSKLCPSSKLLSEYILVLVSSFTLEEQLHLYQLMLDYDLPDSLVELDDYSTITSIMNQMNLDDNQYNLSMFLWFYMQNSEDSVKKLLFLILCNSQLLPILRYFVSELGKLFKILDERNPGTLSSILLNCIKHSSEDERQVLIDIIYLFLESHVLSVGDLKSNVINILTHGNEEDLVLLGLQISKVLITSNLHCDLEFSHLIELLEDALVNCAPKKKELVLQCLKGIDGSLYDGKLEYQSKHMGIKVYLESLRDGGEMMYCNHLVLNIDKLCVAKKLGSTSYMVLLSKALMLSTDLEYNIILNIVTSHSCLGDKSVVLANYLPKCICLWKTQPSSIKRCLELFCLSFKEIINREIHMMRIQNILECFHRLVYCHNVVDKMECLTTVVLKLTSLIVNRVENLSISDILSVLGLFYLIEDSSLRFACVAQFSTNLEEKNSSNTKAQPLLKLEEVEITGS